MTVFRPVGGCDSPCYTAVVSRVVAPMCWNDDYMDLQAFTSTTLFFFFEGNKENRTAGTPSASVKGQKAPRASTGMGHETLARDTKHWNNMGHETPGMGHQHGNTNPKAAASSTVKF